MDVSVERHGGFPGVPARGSRKDAELTPSQRQAAARLLASPPPARPAAGSDRFSYKVTITDKGVSHNLTVPEDAMPEALAEIAQIQL